MAEKREAVDVAEHLLSGHTRLDAEKMMHASTKEAAGSETSLGRLAGFQTTQKRVGSIQRFTPLVSAIISTILSIMLVVADIRPWLFPVNGDLAFYVSYNRTDVAVVVQIIGTLLGFFWTYSVTSAFNLTVRSKLMDSKTIVERLRLYVALSKKAFDLSLPAWYLLISLTFYGVSFLPAWLWTGCLTPHFVTVYQNDTRTVFVPRSNAPMPPPVDVIDVSCKGTKLYNGTFSPCPVIASSSQFVAGLGTSSSFRPKINNPSWTVEDRSYGVGSSVGLTDSNYLDQYNAANYSFIETGLNTAINCSYNRTASWSFSDSQTSWSNGNSSGFPNIFWAEGKRPNECWAGLPPKGKGSGNGYTVTSFKSTPDTVVAFSAGGCCCTKDGRPPYQLSIAAGSQYNAFDTIQCDLTFTPMTFNVSAYMDTYVMNVFPVDMANSTAQHQVTIERALRALQSLTQVETTAYSSSVGEALMRYIGSLSSNGSSFDAGRQTDDVPYWISEALELTMDDILMSLDSYTLAMSNFSMVDAAVQEQWLMLGSMKFHLGLLVINVIALLAILAVTVWTRAFAGTPAFNFADLVSMVIASHNGAVGVAEIAWEGDAGDIKLNKMELDMRNRIGDHNPPSVVIPGA